MYLSSSWDSKKSDSTDTGSTSSGYKNARFAFPSAPRLCKSLNNTSCSVSCHSDSSASDGQLIKSKRRLKKKQVRNYPPIGVFWDIENCQVPRNKSAAIIVQRIRELFFDEYREVEFVVVCDVNKENPHIIQDLQDAQVNVIHVLSISKNAADEKLRQLMRRFAEAHPAPATVILISGDVNFAGDLSTLRYKKKIHVILVHNANVADALILCASETYKFSAITDNLPLMKNKMTEYVDLMVSNLPTNYKKNPVKNRLSLLSDNCGGKVIEVNTEIGEAKIRFSSMDFAVRAQKRLHGEDVFGKKITVSNPNEWRSHFSPKHFGNKFTRNFEGDGHQQRSRSSENSYFNRASCREASWRLKTREQELRLNEDEAGANQNEFDNSIKRVEHNSNNSFQPIAESVELMISNLDSSIKDLNVVLLDLIKEHGKVYGLNIMHLQNLNTVALVKVASQNEAQNIISQLHHQKLGGRRMVISYNRTNNLHLTDLREMVVTILQEARLHRMPLSRLLYLLEQRYLVKVSVWEVNKIRDICCIRDTNGERIISLSPELKWSPLANSQRTNMMYCSLHCPNGITSTEDFCMEGSDDSSSLHIPCINMPLKTFSMILNVMLNSHKGTLPMLSFAVCYKHLFNEPLPLDPKAVPLEHIITCVNNVKLMYGGPSSNVKYIIRDTNPPVRNDCEKDASTMKTLSPSIVSNIRLLCRELVDLLKTAEKCQILLSKYIPAYHHHFGRQMRVADYGYIKLSDLFQNPVITNVIQILGEGNNRVITLTHSAQMRRFTSDLLRVLKTCISKQQLASEFPAAYEKTLKQPFRAVEYGLCSLEDLLEQLPEHTVVIQRKDDDVLISIPKREQTSEEIVRTRQFAEEVVNLLSYFPQCSMHFNKFVPAYHHHFGYQCRVSDYGFSKVIELFEAIPDTVKIEQMSNGERRVCLTLPKALCVRGMQIANLIRKSELSCIPVESLAFSFQREYGFALQPQHFSCNDMNELVSKLSEHIKLTQTSAGLLLVPVESSTHSTVALRVWALLVFTPHHMSVDELLNLYNTKYQTTINISNLEELNNIIINRSGGEANIFLTPSFAMAAKVYLMLYKEGGNIAYNDLNGLYKKYYGSYLFEMQKHIYEKLLTDFSFLIVLRRTKKYTIITLNPKIIEIGLMLPNSGHNEMIHLPAEESSNWPPPPMRSNPYYRRITPPKPDTPPAPGMAPWNSWNTPTKHDDKEFSVQMPSMDLPKNMGTSSYSLISPNKYLLPAHSFSSGSISSPHPGDLPMPDKLLNEGSESFRDSGISFEN